MGYNYSAWKEQYSIYLTGLSHVSVTRRPDRIRRTGPVKIDHPLLFLYLPQRIP